MSWDHNTMAQAFSRPGIDPRQWISLGTVNEDSPDAHSVRFKDDDGAPLPTGPMVTVTLQPSGITVSCRVASFLAGVGEGSWFPFMQRDEVIVALPGGEESGCPVIIGRLNQELDTWPATVAGQDATKNTFGFWRMRTPFVIESAESFLIRSAKTGSQIGIDSTGQVVLNNGDKHNIFISSDTISISNGEEDVFLQLNFSERRATLAVGDARMELAASGESIFHAPGAVNIGSGGARGSGHAVTIEQVIGLLMNYTVMLKNAGVAALSSILSTPEVLDATFAAMIPLLATPTPPPSGLPVSAHFGLYTTLPTTWPALNLALLATPPLQAVDATGMFLGVGRASLMY